MVFTYPDKCNMARSHIYLISHILGNSKISHLIGLMKMTRKYYDNWESKSSKESLSAEST